MGVSVDHSSGSFIILCEQNFGRREKSRTWQSTLKEKIQNEKIFKMQERSGLFELNIILCVLKIDSGKVFFLLAYVHATHGKCVGACHL